MFWQQLGATPTGFFDPATTASLSAIAPILQKGAQYLPTILNIVEDPALPMVVGQIQQLRALEQKARTSATAAGQPAPGPAGPVGIGLHRFVGVIGAYIWTRTHPWETRGIAALGVGVLFGLGFAVGRLSVRQ